MKTKTFVTKHNVFSIPANIRNLCEYLSYAISNNKFIGRLTFSIYFNCFSIKENSLEFITLLFVISFDYMLTIFF